VDSNGACASTAEAATAASGVAAAATTLAMDVKCLGLVQVAMISRRAHIIKEEESIDAERTEEEAREEEIVGEMEEAVSLQAGQQSVRRRSLFGTATIKLNRTAGNHSDSSTSRGLQPGSQSPVSNRGSALNANRATAFGPFSSNGSWLNMWIGFRQLSTSLHTRVLAARQDIAAASMRAASWAPFTALMFFTVLVCVWLGGKGIRSNASTVSGTIRPPGEAPPGSLRQPQTSRRTNAFSERANLNVGCQPLLTSPRLPTSMASPSEGPTSAMLIQSTDTLTHDLALFPHRNGPACFGSALSLPPPPEARDLLCPVMVTPRNCESLLRIHIKFSTNCFHVLDAEGKLVVHVELRVGKTILHCDGFILAQFVAKPVHGGVDEIQLLRANGEYFAKLVQGGLGLTNCPSHEPLATWTIQTRVGVEWFVLRHCYKIDIRDNLGIIVAVAQQIEETGTRDQPGDAEKAYLLRVSPLMDVSIALCAILAVNHLLRL